MSCESAEAMPSPQVIPGLPNEIALTILARLPHAVWALLRGVCRSWKHSLEPAAMSAIQKTLPMRNEVWLVFSPPKPPAGSLFELVDPYSRSVFEIVDPFSGCFSRICLPPQLYAQRSNAIIKVCGVINHEVLISVVARDFVTRQIRPQLNGLYSFDVACMKWNGAKFSSLPSNGFRKVSAVDMEGGYLYAEAQCFVTRMDLKTKIWEILPDPHVQRVDFWGGMLQNRFCIAGGLPVSQFRYCRDRWTSGEMWNPIDRTWTLLPEVQTWACDMCRHSCPSEKLAVLKDRLYGLRIGARSVDVLYYETSSLQWISLGRVPGSDINDGKQSDFILFAVGEELWVLIPNSGLNNTMLILTTKPSLSKSLSWRVLLERPRLGKKFSGYYVGEMLVT